MEQRVFPYHLLDNYPTEYVFEKIIRSQVLEEF